MSERAGDTIVLLERVNLLGEDQAIALKRVRLTPWGRVESKSGTFVIDTEAARSIVREFQAHGVALPIDVNHESIDESLAPKDLLGAVGWIEKIEAMEGDGIYGWISWNERGRELVRSGSFAYLSPVLNLMEKKVFSLHSAAICNKPAIPGMEKLAATERVAAAETSEDEGKAFIKIIGQIANALGIEEVGSEPMDALAAILDRVAGKNQFANMERRIACAAREKLGLAADADADAVCNAIETRKFIDPWLANGFIKANSEEHRELVRLAAADRALANRYLAMVEREARDRVEQLVEREGVLKGIINPNAKADMQICRDIAARDPELFVAWLRERPVQLPPGLTTPPSADTMKRRGAIQKAICMYDADPRIGRITSKATFINSTLLECGEKKMSAEESEHYVKP